MGRLIRKDLIDSSPILLEEESLFLVFHWRVYEDYELLPSDVEVSDSRYIQAVTKRGRQEPELKKVYNPFTDYPHLFLDFARLVERRDPPEALLDWFREYGLLGLTPCNPRYADPHSPVGEFLGRIVPRSKYDDRGGPGDFLEYVWILARYANRSLILYEAALGRNEEKLEQALFAEDPEHAKNLRQTLELRAEKFGASWLDTLVGAALWETLELTMPNIHAYTYPNVTMPQLRSVSTVQKILENNSLTVDHLTRSWGARNLIGAMSLQFYWLMTSASDLSRCKHCGRIIPYASPPPTAEGLKGRKPRKDKEFCDRRCRQNYHYHNRVKSRLQGQGA